MATWILVGDASRARLFEARARRRLRKVQEFDNPAGRLAGRELTSDRPGRIQQRAENAVRSGVAPSANRHELEAERFARRLAEVLREGYFRRDFTEVILVAPPHFLGRLRAHLDPQVARHVSAAIDKDLTAQDERKLARSVGERVSGL